MPITDYYTLIELHTKTKTPNGRGGSTYVWAKASEFQGLINQASSREIEAAAKLSIEADHKLYCPVGTSLSNEKLLKQGSTYYRVVSKPKDTVSQGHHYKVLLKEVQLDGQ